MSQVEAEEAVRSVGRCIPGGSCLSRGQGCPCEIEAFVHDMILFVKPPRELKCIYVMPLGEEFFCVSPERGEIYERFGSCSARKEKEEGSSAEAIP